MKQLWKVTMFNDANTARFARGRIFDKDVQRREYRSLRSRSMFCHFSSCHYWLANVFGVNIKYFSKYSRKKRLTFWLHKGPHQQNRARASCAPIRIAGPLSSQILNHFCCVNISKIINVNLTAVRVTAIRVTAVRVTPSCESRPNVCQNCGKLLVHWATEKK